MLLCLGLDSQFAMVETLMAALHDIPQAATPPPCIPALHTLHTLTHPHTPSHHTHTPPPPLQITLRKERLSALLCILMLVCGLIFVTEQGVHWLEVCRE
jgi:hypothetical protein